MKKVLGSRRVGRVSKVSRVSAGFTGFTEGRGFLAFVFLFVFAACQNFTPSPGVEVSVGDFALTDFRNDQLYGRFAGSNIDLSGDLWNNCFDFMPPSSVSLTNFADYEWRSTVYSDARGDASQVYYPNEIRDGVLYITNSYFLLRYDITSTTLDNIDNWEPVTDAPLFFLDHQKAIEGGKSLNGQTIFQIVYFRNFRTDQDGNKEVQFNFGSRVIFKDTASLPSDPAALREEYSDITVELFDITVGLINGLQEPYFVTYREVSDPIDSGSQHAFPDNDNDKTCP